MKFACLCGKRWIEFRICKPHWEHKAASDTFESEVRSAPTYHQNVAGFSFGSLGQLGICVAGEWGFQLARKVQIAD